jgi:hypothetical protein
MRATMTAILDDYGQKIFRHGTKRTDFVYLGIYDTDQDCVLVNVQSTPTLVENLDLLPLLTKDRHPHGDRFVEFYRAYVAKMGATNHGSQSRQLRLVIGLGAPTSTRAAVGCLATQYGP